MPKLGILGGTFNPIHVGHIEMAEAAKSALGLDRVLFIPSGNPPHKKRNGITDAKIRFEMVQKSVEGIDGFTAYDYEINKESFSYTAETLEHLSDHETELYFILGADSLDYIENWHRPDAIFRLAAIAVFGRDDFDSQKKAENLKKKFGGRIIFLKDKITDISSTKIRMMCDMGLDISAYVPKGAREVITANRLYLGHYTELREQVKKVLKASRFTHTEGVIKTAVKMAEIFDEDIEKTYISALLHDSAKNLPDLQRLCEKYSAELDEFEKSHPQLIHAKLGAELARSVYRIEDPEIINAIKWHTLGRIGMTRLEKIIFVADMAEPNRNFPNVEEIRAAAFKNLDEAVCRCLEQTIKYNEEQGNDVHPTAYELLRHFKEE